MIQSSLSDEANKKLQSIRFPSIQKQNDYNIDLTPFPSFSLRVRDWYDGPWYSVELDEWAKRYSILPGPTTMPNTGIQSDTLAGVGKEKIKECITIVEQYQTAYLNYVGKIEKNNQNIEEIRPKLEEEENKYTKLMTQKQRATSQFENKYILYITEGTWGADGYIDSNLYYADATRALTVAAMPKVEYSLTGNDLSKLTSPIDLEDETWGESFIYDVGDTTYVKDTELFANLEQTIMIAER